MYNGEQMYYNLAFYLVLIIVFGVPCFILESRFKKFLKGEIENDKFRNIHFVFFLITEFFLFMIAMSWFPMMSNKSTREIGPIILTIGGIIGLFYQIYDYRRKKKENANNNDDSEQAI